MKHINDYGKKLIDDFLNKTTMREDIENDTFLGTMFYEHHIKTVYDAVGWMLETYDIDAINILEDWLDVFGNAWYIPLDEIKTELLKCLD